MKSTFLKSYIDTGVPDLKKLIEFIFFRTPISFRIT